MCKVANLVYNTSDNHLFPYLFKTNDPLNAMLPNPLRGIKRKKKRSNLLRSTNSRMHRARWIPRMWRAITIQHTQLTLIHTLPVRSTLGIRASPERRLTASIPTPALRSNVAAPADTNAPGAIVAPRSPSPSRTPCNGQMIPSEREPRTRHTNQRTKQHIEPEMTEIGKASACYVDGGTDGDQDEDQGVNGWSGVLVADGYYCVVVVGGWG